MMNAAELRSNLAQFTGTENYWKNPMFGNFLYTDGAQYLAEKAEAYWLIDIIGSHQILPKVYSEEFQFWKLVKTGGDSAVVTMTDGNDGEPIVTQKIEFTDFPLDEIKFYVCAQGRNRILMLPSEY